MSGYVEGLLRPADELLSAGMFGLASVAVTLFPSLFLLPSMASPIVGCALFSLYDDTFKAGA